jgi:UDP:flavonoid glycosyltransferase YjiC (YdhE family)
VPSFGLSDLDVEVAVGRNSDPADQFPTATACRAAGAAEVVTPDRLTESEVRHAVLAVLGDESYRRASAEVTFRELLTEGR